MTDIGGAGEICGQRPPNDGPADYFAEGFPALLFRSGRSAKARPRAADGLPLNTLSVPGQSGAGVSFRANMRMQRSASFLGRRC
jgi:hypothetical protein